MNIFILFLITFFSPLIGKLMKSSLDYYSLSKQYKNGNSLHTLLTRLTPKEFLSWSTDFITFLGFNNINSINYFSQNSFLCTKENTTFFIECNNNSSDTLCEDDINKFIGKLITLSISSGIIITSSDIKDDLYELISNYSNLYQIYVISLKKPTTYSSYFLS